MKYRYIYKTPDAFSDLIMLSDGESLTGLYFEGTREKLKIDTSGEEILLPVFMDTAGWLDIYFGGREPDFIPKYVLNNLSPFRKAVTEHMLEVGFGELKTYGEIASKIALETGKLKMSAQAVGGAVGHNPISIIIPCHRIIGSGFSLTGYGGGIDNKIALLELEGHDPLKFRVPK